MLVIKECKNITILIIKVVIPLCPLMVNSCSSSLCFVFSATVIQLCELGHISQNDLEVVDL